MKYKILDENDRIVEEKELRKMLFSCELGDLQNNEQDYFEGHLILDNQFECIKTALNGSIEQVIEMLEYNWNVPIETVNENEEKIISLINDTFKDIQNKENTTNALDFVHKLIDYLQKKYR